MIKRRSSHGSTVTPPPASGQPRADKPDGGTPQVDAVTERIGEELRKMFEIVVAEPVPEKFRHLLDDLAGKSEKP
jgi:anti-sigma factor NepR-like protein